MQRGFPTHFFKELCFHLKELRLDIVASVKECKSLFDTPTEFINLSEKTQLLLKIRYAFESLITRLEHVIMSHLSQSLRIIGQTVDNSSLLETSESFASFQTDWNLGISDNSDDVQIKTLADIYMNLQYLTLEFNSVLEQVDQLLSEKIDDVQSNRLKETLVKITEVIVSQIQPKVVETYLQSVRLYYALDPVAAKQDEDWNLLATPLHEEIHPLARSLDVCPNCNAPLTGDDRTFDGCYCENCRTRWIQSI